MGAKYMGSAYANRPDHHGGGLLNSRLSRNIVSGLMQ